MRGLHGPFFFLNRRAIFGGVCVFVDLRMDTKRHVCKEIELYAQTLLTILLSSLVNVNWGTYMTF